MANIQGLSPLSASLAPETQNLSPAQQTLNAFRANYSPEIPTETMLEMVQQGKSTLNNLQEAARGNTQEWISALGKMNLSQQNAVNVMWALYEKMAESGNLFLSGSIRLGGQVPLTNEKMEDFLRACGGAKPNSDTPPKLVGGLAYTRISTHLKEHITADSLQYGLDIRNLTMNDKPSGLPGDKRTLLFAKQPDGSLFIKPEEHGCPPLKQAGVSRSENFLELIGHGVDYIRTRPFFGSIRFMGNAIIRADPTKVLSTLVTKIFLQLHIFAARINDENIPTRKEKVPQDAIDKFRTFLAATNLSPQERKKALEEGKKYGRYKMQEVANFIQANPNATKLPKTGVPPEQVIQNGRQNAHLAPPTFLSQDLMQKNVMQKGNEVYLSVGELLNERNGAL